MTDRFLSILGSAYVGVLGLCFFLTFGIKFLTGIGVL